MDGMILGVCKKGYSWISSDSSGTISRKYDTNDAMYIIKGSRAVLTALIN